MANQRNTARQLEFADLDQSDNLALPVPAKEAPGADKVDAAALSVAIDDSADEGYDPPETYDEYGDPRDDYADAVGISCWREL